MKKIKFTTAILLFFVAFSFTSCSTGDNPVDPHIYDIVIPVVTTTEITGIDVAIATSGGNVVSAGNSTITERGVVWSTTENPTITNSKTTNGIGTGTFVSSLSGLTANTTYYLRAYAINEAGVAYGNQITFITLLTTKIPTITTESVSGVTTTGATSGGEITADGGSPVTARGVVWSTSSNPTILDSKTTNGAGTGIFTSTITGLTANTIYYLRAYATNSFGTAYGNQKTFSATTTTTTPSTLMAANVYGIQRDRLQPFGYPFGGDTSVQHWDNSTSAGVNYLLLQGGNNTSGVVGTPGDFEINIRIPQSQWSVGTHPIIENNDEDHDNPKTNVDFIQFSNTVSGERVSSGTITITEFNTTTRKIKGTFSFVYYNAMTSGGPEEGPFNVSNGTFDYKLDDSFFD